MTKVVSIWHILKQSFQETPAALLKMKKLIFTMLGLGVLMGCNNFYAKNPFSPRYGK